MTLPHVESPQMSRASLPKKAAQAVGQYLRKHPEEVVRAAKNAASLKLGVPLAAVRWVIRELGGKKTPRNLVIEARSPGIFVSASLELMKTEVQASTTILIEEVDLRQDALLLVVRLTDVRLSVPESSAATPIAALLRAGALDLSRPGDLVSYLPSRPPVLVEAKGDRFQLDLLRLPSLSKDKARKIVAALTPLVGIATVRGTEDHIDIELDPLPRGAKDAFEQWKRLFSSSK